MMNRSMTLSTSLVWSLLTWSSLFLTNLTPFVAVEAKVSCYSIFDCGVKVGEGSDCIEGFCSNPYHKGGCLAKKLENRHRVRTCNSDDPPEAVEQGHCRLSPMDYTEVRIYSQNWESVFFEAWIMQILLSEILDVPVSIETGSADAKVDFYDIHTSFDYGTGNDFIAVETAENVKDCRVVKNRSGKAEDYVPCSHVIPEVWAGGQRESLRSLQDEQVIEPPAGLGALGTQSWFVPKFTAEQDTTLLTYLGLQGQDNRHKLAATFLRPTTWEDYCLYESPDGCQTPDNVATRPPVAEEGDLYYEGEEFTGFFRNTTQNDCVAWPNNCTGHIVDYPCGWSSYVSQQAYHLNIAVESNGKQPGSNGYSYSEMTQIWNAASATNSSVLMQWWQPEALYQQFLGTHAEFTRVSLPPPTQQCVDNRVSAVDRCSSDPMVRVGDPLGRCHEAPQVLVKVVSTALYDISYDPDVPEALHSPAYETIKDFRISDLQLGQIFEYWFAVNKDKYGLDPREAACQWVVENMKQLETFIPKTHPRLIEDNDEAYQDSLHLAAIIISCIAMGATVLSMVITYVQRDKQIMRIQQVEFLFLLLGGLLLVSIGSLLNALPPTNPICVSVVWLVNLGYTFEFVPLIVKVAAINRLMVAAQQMRRLELHLASVYGSVLAIAFLVGVGLTIWTAVDPPQSSYELTLTEGEGSFGEAIIDRTYFCQSEEEFWYYLGVSWQLLLLIAASVLAFQTRKMSEDINETRTLAMLIYSHFVFVILRAITYFVSSSGDQVALAAARSFMYSADVLACVVIYFIPKFSRTQGIEIGALPSIHNGAKSQKAKPSMRSVHQWKTQPTNSGSAQRRNQQEKLSVESIEIVSDGGQRVASSHSIGQTQQTPITRATSLRETATDYRTNAVLEHSDDDDDDELGLEVFPEDDEEDVSSFGGENDTGATSSADGGS